MFLNCSACFGRHTAHHQDLKNCNCSFWFYIHRSGRQPKTYVKSEAVITVFELLMMGGVSPETCWAIKKHCNNKFYYTVASCLFFLWVLNYDARIHEHQVHSLLASALMKNKWNYTSIPPCAYMACIGTNLPSVNGKGK